MRVSDPERCLSNFLDAMRHPAGTVLDVAAGTGRNAVWVANQGLRVHCIDRDSEKLASISDKSDLISTETVDLEIPDVCLGNEQYAGAIVFRYLHRPLFPILKQAIQPGGWVLYQTFRVEQRRFGRPTNGNFLLQDGELKTLFKDWEIEDYWEGYEYFESGRTMALARIFARKS